MSIYKFKGCENCGKLEATNGVLWDGNIEICESCSKDRPAFTLDVRAKWEREGRTLCHNQKCLHTPAGSHKHCSSLCSNDCVICNPPGLSTEESRQKVLDNGKTPCHNPECSFSVCKGHKHCSGECSDICKLCGH